MYKAHLSTKWASSIPTSPSRLGKTKEMSKDVKDKTVDLHKAGMDYEAVNKKLGEEVTTRGATIRKGKKYKSFLSG